MVEAALANKIAPKRTSDITEVINSFKKKLAPHDIIFDGYTRISLNKFYDLPTQTQDAIKQAISYTSGLVSEVIDINRNIDDVHMVVKACADVNLVLPDDFLRRIRKGDVVEVYETETMIQIYRNFEFLKHCSYDLLTVCLTPLHELFERQTGSDEMVFQRARDICLNGSGAERWNVSDHTLVEKMEKHNRIFHLKLGYIAPVTHKITGKKIAWASTLRVERVGSLYEDCENVSPL